MLNNIEAPIHSSKDSTLQNFSNSNPYLINLIHINANELSQFINIKGLEYLEGKYNIGYWAWELSRFPDDWSDRFKYFNEIWVPSSFVLDSVSEVSPIPVIRIPHIINIDESQINNDKNQFGISPDAYLFLFTFDFHSHFERKNPLALVESFKLAFKDSTNVVLVLKYMNHTYYPLELKALKKAISDIDNIKIIDTHMRKEDIYSLIACCDCLVSPHRSEGFGLTLAEAMYLKKPVIATGYSGNMDFMNVNNSFPVRYRLIEVGEKDYPPFKKGYIWADPDINHIVELIRFVYENREYAVQIGEQASEDIKNLLSPNIVGKRVRERLERILANV